ncbi:transcriptional regulator [candidate division TA06 bacterium]|uniref:Transcriptional regulator n=1 Tax=candidate division TA06 bacterium TaxID=2250710 RepID=A0A523UZA1_UNCT6|nr:MAG: transcriptional regulator [candidate division TA06 bacterium]
MNKLAPLDPIIHAPVRLAILTVLMAVKEADFNYLKETTGTTDGNLSTHLTKLEQTKYIKVTKTFVGKKPRTKCSITQKGLAAYQDYIRILEEYIKR